MRVACPGQRSLSGRWHPSVYMHKCTQCISMYKTIPQHTTHRLFENLDLHQENAHRQACTALHGCVKLFYRPPVRLVRSLVECVAAGMVNQQDDLGVQGSRCLLACFHLAYMPPMETLESVLNLIVKHTNHGDEQRQINALYAIAGLLCMTDNSDAMRRLMPQLRALVPQGTLSEANWQQVKTAQLACRIMGVGELVPAHVAAEFARPPHSPTLTQSWLQHRVVHVLKSLADVFVEVEEEVAVLDGSNHVDALCITHSGTKVAVEVNGPRHFFVNQPYVFNGPTRFKLMLLRRQGYVVVPMNHHELSLSHDGDFEGSVRQLLRQHGVDVMPVHG